MAALLALIVVVPALIIAPGYLFYFDVTPKVVALLGGTALALVWASRDRSQTSLRSPLLKWFTGLLALDGVSLLVSAALSQRPGLSLLGTNWRRFGSIAQASILLFTWLVAICCAGRPDRVKWILRSVATSSALAAAYGIAQYLGWDPLLPAAAYHVGEGIWTIVRPPSTLGHADYFAAWLCSSIFLSLTLAAMEKSAVWRRIALAAAGVACVAVVFSGSRAAMLALAAGMAVWAVQTGNRVTLRKVTLRKAALFTAVAVAAVAFYYSPPGRQLRSRTRWFVEDPWGGGRPELWRDSLNMAEHRLATGYGPELFMQAFPRFESAALAEAYPDFAHESPHNAFLDTLVAQGLPGMIAICGLCALGFVAARRLGASQPGAGSALFAALTAEILGQQFVAFTVPTALVFYATIALAVGMAAAPGAPAESADPAPQKSGAASRRFQTPAAIAALALSVVAVRFLVADRALALSKRSLDSGDLPAAFREYDSFQRWSLPGGGSDLWYSRALFLFAQNTPNPVARFQALQQAGIAAMRATRTAEDPFNAWYNVAAFYASQNDAPRTEASLRQAIAGSPKWFKPHWMLAQVLLLDSRFEEAENEAAMAVKLDGRKNPEVARTLQEVRGRHRSAISGPLQ
jgi:O-antigen ligase